jgi:ribonuclease HI
MNTLLTRFTDEPDFKIYTDGSYNSIRKSSTIGLSFIVEYDENMVHTYRKKMPVGRAKKNLGALYAETVALVSAVSYVINKGLNNVVIYSDSRFAVDAIHHPNKAYNNVLEAYITKMQYQLNLAYEAGIYINVMYCKGHVGIHGNEAADILAKHARKGKNVIGSLYNCVNDTVDMDARLFHTANNLCME